MRRLEMLMEEQMSDELKIAIVTGAGSGVGRAAALALLEDGWSVTLTGRREDPLHETAEQSGAKARTLVHPADVSKPDAVADLFSDTLNSFGRLDLSLIMPGKTLRVFRWRSYRSNSGNLLSMLT